MLGARMSRRHFGLLAGSRRWRQGYLARSDECFQTIGKGPGPEERSIVLKCALEASITFVFICVFKQLYRYNAALYTDSRSGP